MQQISKKPYVKPVAIIKSFFGRKYHESKIGKDVCLVKRSLFLDDCFGNGLAPVIKSNSTNSDNDKENYNNDGEIIYCTLTREKNYYVISTMSIELEVNGQALTKGYRRILKTNDKISVVGEPNLNFYFTYFMNQVIAQNFHADVLKDYHIECVIGKGACGESFLVRDIRTLRKFAVKRLTKTASIDNPKDYHYEARMHQLLDHPNIVKLMKVHDTKAYTYIFTEFLNRNDMLAVIKSRPNNKLSEDECKEFLHQVVQGLKYLHGQNICHRDIKCDNIFVNFENNRYVCKIGDFGLSAFNENLRDSCGTIYYAPPELFVKKNEPYNGLACDIWSLGVSMYCMLTGRFPFHDEDKTKLAKIIAASRIDFGTTNMSYYAKHLICCMINRDPTFRYRINEVERHPWFTDSQPVVFHSVASSTPVSRQLKRKKPTEVCTNYQPVYKKRVRLA